jgi:release factor glutamine methyltransferase
MKRSRSGGALGERLSWAEALLAAARVPNPRRAAERLLAHVLGVERYQLYVDFERSPEEPAADRFTELVTRRAEGEPLAYLVGEVEFMSLPFGVGPEVLIPRPETEVLVEAVLEGLRSAGDAGSEGGVIPLPVVADIGTGSGVVAASIAWYEPRATVYATDLSANALARARANAERHGLQNRIRFLAGDLFQPLEGSGLEGGLTAVVSNPPYVATPDVARLPREVRDHEPRIALDGGLDGLDVIRRLAAETPRWLREDGFLAFEVGAGQAPQVLDLLARGARWRARAVRDYTGIERVVMAHRTEAG